MRSGGVGLPPARRLPWAGLVAVVALTACVPTAEPDPGAPPSASVTSSASAPTAAASDVAALVPVPSVATLTVTGVLTAEAPRGQTQLVVTPEVVATGDVDVAVGADRFRLVVAPDRLVGWSGMPPEAATSTLITPRGAAVGLLPVNDYGFSERGPAGGTTATHWDLTTLAPGESSAAVRVERPDTGLPERPGPWGPLVFYVPPDDDGSLVGVLGLALLGADDRPIAFTDATTWDVVPGALTS